MIPLLYTDVLPVFRGFDKMLVPVFEAPKPPPEAVTPVRTRRAANEFREPILRAPSQIPATVAVIDERASAPQFDDLAVSAAGMYIPGAESLPAVRLAPPPAPAAPPKVEAPPPPAAPVAVSSTIQAAKLIKRVLPPYPPLAVRTRTFGLVKLLAVIGKDGRVRTLEVLQGHPLLRKAAEDAVRQWVYSPTILNGEAVEVQAEIDVNFTLH